MNARASREFACSGAAHIGALRPMTRGEASVARSRGSRPRNGPAGSRVTTRGSARAAHAQVREPRVRLVVHVHTRPRLSRRGGAESSEEGGHTGRGGRARAAAPTVAPAAAAGAHRGVPRVPREPRGSGFEARVRRPARRVEARVQGSGFIGQLFLDDDEISHSALAVGCARARNWNHGLRPRTESVLVTPLS